MELINSSLQECLCCSGVNSCKINYVIVFFWLIKLRVWGHFCHYCGIIAPVMLQWMWRGDYSSTSFWKTPLNCSGNVWYEICQVFAQKRRNFIILLILDFKIRKSIFFWIIIKIIVLNFYYFSAILDGLFCVNTCRCLLYINAEEI